MSRQSLRVSGSVYSLGMGYNNLTGSSNIQIPSTDQDNPIYDKNVYNIPVYFSSKNTSYNPYEANAIARQHVNNVLLADINFENNITRAHVSGELILHVEPDINGNILTAPDSAPNLTNIAYDIVYSIYVSGHIHFRDGIPLAENHSSLFVSYNKIKASLQHARPIWRETLKPFGEPNGLSQVEFDQRVTNNLGEVYDNTYGFVTDIARNVIKMGPFNVVSDSLRGFEIRTAGTATTTGLNIFLSSYRNNAIHNLIDGDGNPDPGDLSYFQGNISDPVINDSPESQLTLRGELTIVTA